MATTALVKMNDTFCADVEYNNSASHVAYGPNFDMTGYRSSKVTCDCTTSANTFLIFAMIVITAIYVVRITSARIQNRAWELDNIAANISYALTVIMIAMGLTWSVAGGTDDTESPPDILTRTRYLPFLGVYYAAVLSVKLSLLLFYARVFTINQQAFRLRFKGLVGVLIMSNAAILILWTAIVYMLFASTVTFWDNNIDREISSPAIWKLTSSSYQVTGVGNAITDVLLFSTAIVGLWRTQLQKKDKKKAAILLSLGFMATGASIFRAIQASIDLNSKWGAANQNVAHLATTVLETGLGFVCLCIPSLNDVLIRKGYLRKWYAAWVTWIKSCPLFQPFRPTLRRLFSRKKSDDDSLPTSSTNDEVYSSKATGISQVTVSSQDQGEEVYFVEMFNLPASMARSFGH